MKNPNAMSCLDIYTSVEKSAQLEKFQKGISTDKMRVMPLMSWDIFATGHLARMEAAIKQKELQQVLRFAKKFNWKNDLAKAFEAQDYEALIITDKHQNIMWVNNGFTEMTGYSKGYAIDKTPRFLQGEKTSESTRARIRTNIEQGKPFKEIIYNYKKDGTPYKCQVHVIPLFNNETTHYIAFEKKVA